MPRKGKKYVHKHFKYQKNETNMDLYFTLEEQDELKTILNTDKLTIPFVIGAAILNKFDLIKILFKQGFDLNETDQDNSSALIWSVRRKHKEIIDFLLSKRIDNNDFQNGLFLAVESKIWDESTFISFYNKVKETARIDINYRNKNNRSILLTAVKREWEQCVQILINDKANINMEDLNGVTPLMFASYLNNSNIVNNLIESGADPLKEDNKKSNALCYAISTIIAKNLPKPHLIVTKLLGELDKNGTTFKEYLERRVTIAISTPMKQNKNMPGIYDRKTNVILYAIKYMRRGVNFLVEIDIFGKMKRTLENHSSDSLIVRKNLIILKYILQYSQEFTDNTVLLNDFVKSGVADCCLSILKRYEQDDTCDWNSLIFSSLINLVDSEETKLWIEKNYDCIKFLKESSSANLPQNLINKFSHCIDNKIKSIDQKILAKKTKRRSKALKAKIAKIKSADLTGRLNNQNGRKIKQQSISDTDFVQSKSIANNTELVGDIKKILCDCCNGDYFNINNNQIIGGVQLTVEEIDQIIDNSIAYLAELLKQITIEYQLIWKQEDLEEMQQLEIESINQMENRFNQLILYIKELSRKNLIGSIHVLDKLEILLKSQKIRDTFIFSQIYHEQSLSLKYLQQLIDKKSDSYHRENPDVMYLREVMSLPPRKLKSKTQQEVDRKNTMENAYHLIPSILSICEDDEEDVLQDYDISKWSPIMSSLQTMRNVRFFMNGDLKMSSVEKRDCHVIAIGGNFGNVELGLDGNNRPLAVKRIARNEPICKAMKNLLNPLMGVRSTHLLHYFSCHYEGEELFLTTPLCEYNIGEYVMLMKQSSGLNLTPLEIVKQFLTGLRFLHDRQEPIVHGNLKPSNVFIDLHGIVRVAEFGIHQVLFSLTKAASTSIIWFSRETLTNFKNTSRMICSCPSDVQVAGMLLHFILTAGSHPYGSNIEEILKNLEKSSSQLNTIDLDLHDLISWMLLYEPIERPTINQVISHVFFWPIEKKWRFILACAGVGPHGASLNMNLKQLHEYIDVITVRDDIRGSWIDVTRHVFGKLSILDEEHDTVTGLLRFIKVCMQNQTVICAGVTCKIRNFILTTFSALPLSLYRILDSSDWLQHKVLQPFTSVDSLSA